VFLAPGPISSLKSLDGQPKYLHNLEDVESCVFIIKLDLRRDILKQPSIPGQILHQLTVVPVAPRAAKSFSGSVSISPSQVLRGTDGFFCRWRAVPPRVVVYMSPPPRYAPLVDSIGVRSRTALGLLSHGICTGNPSDCGENGSQYV
jgi:hypothetical protein